ncbi:MAG: hypothetical protein Q9227_004290 [Pyrenula ochraceoflavens]
MANANVNDCLVRYFNQHIFEYWTSFRASSLRFIQGQTSAPGAVTFVAETDAGDAGPSGSSEKSPGGEVVGFVVWSRQGESAVARNWQRLNTGLSHWMEKQLNSLRDFYFNKVPGVNPTRHKENFAKIVSFLDPGWTKMGFDEFWEVGLLFVNPKYQRRGLARMLLEWGTRQAGTEGVPVVVHSSPVGRYTYEAVGFKVIERREDLEQFFDTGKEGVNKLVWEPEGKTDWLEKTKKAEKQNVEETRKPYKKYAA